MAKVRVYELAKELGLSSKQLLGKLNDMGEFVRSASSTIEAPVVRRLRDQIGSAEPADDAKAAKPAARKSQTSSKKTSKETTTAKPAPGPKPGPGPKPTPGPRPGSEAGSECSQAPRSGPEAEAWRAIEVSEAGCPSGAATGWIRWIAFGCSSRSASGRRSSYRSSASRK